MPAPKASDYRNLTVPKPAAISPVSGLHPTKPDIEGPFYKPSAPFRADITEGLSPSFELTGRVLDTNGNPAVGLTLDVWQADPQGDYDNDTFKHRGKIKTDTDGKYSIRTVRPGDYDISEPTDPQPHEFRCAHIHVKIWKNGTLLLTTQLYFAVDPYNTTDHWFDPARIVDESVPGVVSFDFIVQP